jgi:hypothetical protein
LLVGCVYLPPSALTTADAANACYDQLAADVKRFQQCGEVVIMGDLNSRVGSACEDNQHIGRWGEQTTNHAGLALIDFLRNAGLYTLNNRLPCPDTSTHQPAYTRVRPAPPGQDNDSAQRSIIDYVLMPPKYVLTEPHQVRPPCALQVETTHTLSTSDHFPLWFTMPHPVHRSKPQTFSQPRPNTYKLTLPKTALTHEDWEQREAYPKAIEEQFEDFPALLTKLQDDVAAGTMHPREACEKAKAILCERINAAVDATIGFGRPRRHPSSRVPYIRTRAVKDAVKERDLAAADLLDVSVTDPLNTDAIARAQEQVKETQASLKAAVTDARQRHTDRLIADIDSCKRANDGKGMWKALKTLAGSHDNTRTGPAALRDPNGAGLVTDAHGICEILANQYEQVSSTSTHYRNGDFDAQHRATIETQVKELLEQTSFAEEGPIGLSQPILANEVKAQCHRLNNNKAPSPLDSIHNELLKYGGDALAGHLANFFQMQFEFEVKAKTCGVIVPVYKKADPTEAKNYRPITLGSAIDKLYNLVINARIMTFLEDNNKLHDGQQGFRPGRSSVDNIYMLKTCLDARCQQKLDTYLLFVDIEKAYDTVWRAGLLWHLWQKGITGKMFRVLANMIDNTPAMVMYNGAFSRVMQPDMGWEQGDTLATTMFNVYIDSVLHQVWEEHEGIPVPVRPGEQAAKLTALLYADDLAGVTSTPEAMQRLVDSTRAALTKWQLRASVNPTDTSKTAIMKVLGGCESARRSAATRTDNSAQTYMWGDITIPQVTSYKYLGVTINNINTWDAHFEARLKSGTKAAAAHHKVLTKVRLPVHLRKGTLTTIVQPVVTYAAQVWAQCTQTLRKMLDSWQMGLITRAFHCHAKTSHICLQQELGLFPLHVTCDTLAIRYWHHLENTPADRLLHKIHTAWTGKYHPWRQNMQRLLTQYNIDTSNPTEITKENFKGHVEARAINYLRAYWTQPPRNSSGSVHTRYMADFGIGELTPRRPRIRTYLRAQTLYPRLDDCRAAELFMHFRLETLSLHAFHSHTRHRETAAARHIRELCPSCKQHAETPTHFLLECPAYSIPRSLPHVAACVADAQNSPTQAPWRRLLNQPLMADFILRAWDIRRAALTGRGANGGHSMALTPVPAADITGA